MKHELVFKQTSEYFGAVNGGKVIRPDLSFDLCGNFFICQAHDLMRFLGVILTNQEFVTEFNDVNSCKILRDLKDDVVKVINKYYNIITKEG